MKHEITLTLRPLLYTRTPLEQYNTVTPLLRVALHGYKYTLVAELTKEFNVHYHGIIDIEGTIQKNALLNKLRPLNRFLGRKTCEAVRFEESYEKYIQKDLKETQKVIIDPVVKDDYGIFNKSIFNSISDSGAPRGRRGAEVPEERSVSPPGRVATTQNDPLDFGIDFSEQRI